MVLFIAMLELAFVAPNYTPATADFPYHLLGWGILGLPFLAAFGCLYAIFWRWVARRISKRLAWVLVIVLVPLWAWLVLPSLSPQAHLQHVIGKSAADVATLEYLRLQDSFGDGSDYYGRVSGPPEILQLAATYWHITEPTEGHLPSFGYFTADDNLPNGKVEAWLGNGACLYYHAESGRLYFVARRTGPPQ